MHGADRRTGGVERRQVLRVDPVHLLRCRLEHVLLADLLRSREESAVLAENARSPVRCLPVRFGRPLALWIQSHDYDAVDMSKFESGSTAIAAARGSARLWSAIALLALCVSLAAQSPSVPRTGQASAGTATFSGRVVDFTTNEPVPGALVQIGGPARAAEIAAENGTFEFTSLPAGSYYVTAQRNGYLADFGAPRPGAPGRTTVDLEPGGRSDITVRLLRGGVIAGQVLDSDGRPVQGALVTAAQRLFYRGRRRLTPFSSGAGLPATDDEGRFRIVSLPPGRYVVSAMPTDEAPREATLRGPVTDVAIRTYAPNATELSGASVIELGPGDRHLDVTIVLARGHLASISGIVLLADGSPAVGASINLRGAQQNLDEVLNFALHRGSTTDASGRFHVDNVMPGRFVVEAWSNSSRHPVGDALVELAGTDIEGVVLQQTSVTLRGRFVTEDGTPVAARSHFPTSEGPGALCMLEFIGGFERLDSCTPTSDGFEIQAAPGRYWLQVGSNEGASVKQILQGGRDITDEPLEVSPEVRSELITITLSRAKEGSITGAVTDTLGRPQAGVPVVVFSTNPKRWWVPGARYAQRWTTNGKGVFTMERLASGEYFVATALDVDDWTFSQNGELDPDLLETLRAHATIVNVGEGETRTVSLTIRQ
jgi:protocatechuate 3,4-dioxygenase beta subunit